MSNPTIHSIKSLYELRKEMNRISDDFTRKVVEANNLITNSIYHLKKHNLVCVINECLRTATIYDPNNDEWYCESCWKEKQETGLITHV